MSPRVRVVFDCNVFLQALISSKGPAHACLERAASGHVQLVVSAFVLAELRTLPVHPELRRFSTLTHERVERFIADVLGFSVVETEIPEVFTYPRDPDDAHYVNLAIKAGAILIVSRDRDLRDLGDQSKPIGREFYARFPKLRIVDPTQFVQEFSDGGAE